MTQEWMIHVLADLRGYAMRNYYIGLAEQLDDAMLVAAAEIGAAEAKEAPRGRAAGRAHLRCVEEV